MEVSLVLLTVLGSCCLGLVLLVILVVVVILVLTGKLKSAKVTGLGAGVELESAEPSKPDTPPPADTPTAPAPTPADQSPSNVVVGGGTIDASTHDDHSVHIDADGDVAYGEGARIDKRQGGVDFGEGGDFTGAKISGVAGRDIRRGSAAAKPPGGKAPGVGFGKKAKFRDAEITDVAGRDIVED